MTKCPVCQSDATDLFLQRSHIPVHQNLLCRSEESARNVKRGDLSLFICKDCSFTFNQSFDASLLSYGKDYDNTQMCSSTFRNYINDLIQYLITKRGIVRKSVVELGCGQGAFLSSLCASGDNSGVGLDPSYSGASVLMDGRLKFRRDFYDSSLKSISADIVICRHVIEHICEPVGLLQSVRAALANFPHAQLFFETPSLDWVLNNLVFWDFFYEHCSYFTERPLRIAFKNAGFEVIDIRNAFQGQYLWIEAKLDNGQRQSSEKNSKKSFVLAEHFARKEKVFLQYWKRRLKSLCRLGKVAVWGAGAKGVTFVNLLDPDYELIDCVVDLNPNKQGGFVPGAAHPIVSYYELPSRGVSRAILMNPNYREENQLLLQQAEIILDLI